MFSTSRKKIFAGTGLALLIVVCILAHMEFYTVVLAAAKYANTQTADQIKNQMHSNKPPPACVPRVNTSTCSCTSVSCWRVAPTDMLSLDAGVGTCAFAQQPPVLGIADRCQYERHGAASPVVEQHLVSLVSKAVMGTLYSDWAGQRDGREWPPDSSKSSTMIGERRLENLQFLLEETIRMNVQGDFIETGVWRGGAAILAATIIKAYGQSGKRRVFVADSFQGIPEVDVAKYPADAAHV